MLGAAFALSRGTKATLSVLLYLFGEVKELQEE